MLVLLTEGAENLAHSELRHGYGLFETLRVQDGAPRWLEHHLTRMAAGCAFLGLDAPPPAATVQAFLQAHTSIQDYDHATLRLFAVDGRLLAHLDAAPPPTPGGVKLALSDRVSRYSASPLNRFKTLSYLENRLLQQEATHRGLFDVIALNEHGKLTDGGRTTLLLELDGRYVTPAANDGALPGVARALLLETGLVREASLEAEAFHRASSHLLVNALRGVLPVLQQDRNTPKIPEAIAACLA